MEPRLDWSAYDSYGAGDAYADVPTSGGAFGKAAAVCIGNRQCQRAEKGVMCPSFRITQDTRHSTGHRAAVLREALNGEYGPQPFAGKELQAALDLCMGCKRECPNGVDMALMRTEYLARRWKLAGGPPRRERLFGHLPRYMERFRRLDVLRRLRERIPPLAKLGERVFGIAARRSLPSIAARSFLSMVPATPAGTDGDREIVLLVDTFSNHMEPANAEAALQVLRAAGYRVHIARPAAGERPLCCGRTFLSSGLVDEARQEAQRMVDALWPYVERGMPVIGLEPSCLLMLRDEYHFLGLGDKVEGLAKAVLLLEEFLAREHDRKRLNLKLQALPEVQALVHGHCHQKAFGAMKAMRKVLKLVPDLQMELIESSCCGMAGAFGIEAEHYEASMQMGELALLPKARQAAAQTLLIANGTSCRHQIRDGAHRESLHLAQVLRKALAT